MILGANTISGLTPSPIFLYSTNNTMTRRTIQASLVAVFLCVIFAGATLVGDSLWSEVSIAETLRPDYLSLDAPDVGSDRLIVEGSADVVEVEVVKDWVENRRRRPSRCF